MTKDTELGDNESIKTPKPVECSGSKARRQRKDKELLDAEGTQSQTSEELRYIARDYPG